MAGDGNNNKDEDAPEKPSCGQRMATGCHNFGTFMYNPKDRTVMGRTFTSWIAILGYYIAFYAVLAGFWAACMAGFLRTIDYSQPTQQHKFSMLKDNPGMTFEPMISTDNTIISFNISDLNTTSAYIDRLNTILAPYYNLSAKKLAGDSSASNVQRCKNQMRSNLNYVCLFDVAERISKECLAENNFSFSAGTPCVFLRPNKVFNYWPAAIPQSDRNNSTLDNPPASLFSRLTDDNIAVTCDGETPADQDNLLSVKFFPDEGFPFYYYPYLAQDNYLPPFVMAKFKVIPGRAVMIWCRIWAKDMKHDRDDLQGSIHFELLVDK